MGLSPDGLLTRPYTKMNAAGTGDLQKALKTGRTSHYEMFQYGTINHWALCHAFPSTGIYSGFTSNRSSDRYAAAQAVDFGITNIPVFKNKTMANLFNFWVDNSTAAADQPACGAQSSYWTYQSPSTWAATMNRRADDFAGYYMYASYPVGALQLTNGCLNIDSAGYINIAYNRPSPMSIYNLDFSDFRFDNGQGSYVYASSMYLCFGLQKASTPGDRRVISTRQTLSADNSYSVRVNISGYSSLVATGWIIFPFLSSIQPSSQYITSLPSTAGVFVPVHAKNTGVQITQGHINYELSVTQCRSTGDQRQYVSTTIAVKNDDPSNTFTSITMTVTAYQGTSVLGSQTGISISSIGAGATKTATSQITLGNLQALNATHVVVTVTAKNPDDANGQMQVNAQVVHEY